MDNFAPLTIWKLSVKVGDADLSGALVFILDKQRGPMFTVTGYAGSYLVKGRGSESAMDPHGTFDLNFEVMFTKMEPQVDSDLGNLHAPQTVIRAGGPVDGSPATLVVSIADGGEHTPRPNQIALVLQLLDSFDRQQLCMD